MRLTRRHLLKKLWARLRGVPDTFSVATAGPATFYPLDNDVGPGLRLTHINNITIVVDDPIDLTDYTVTVAADGEVTVASVASYVGAVFFTYTFTDGKSSGKGEVVGAFTA